MSSHSGAIHVRVGHIISWQGMSSHGKAYHLMGGHVISGQGMLAIRQNAYHFSSCHVMSSRHVSDSRGVGQSNYF